MQLQLVEDILELPEEKPDIYKIAQMKAVVEVTNREKIVPPEGDHISISVALEIQYQISYTSTVSKKRIFVETYKKNKKIYLTSESLESKNGENPWDKINFIDVITNIEDTGQVLMDKRKIYTYLLLGVQLKEVKTIVGEEESEDE